MNKRTRLVLFTAATLCTSAFAQPVDCDAPGSVKAAEAQAAGAVQSAKEAQGRREAELDQDVQATEARLGWVQEDRFKFFSGLMASPAIAAFEAEKQPLMAEIRGWMAAAAKHSNSVPAQEKAACEAIVRMQSIIEKVREVNGRQYDFMAREIKAAKK